MEIYIRCCIETDEYNIDDFKNGAIVTIVPLKPTTNIPYEPYEVDKFLTIDDKDIDEPSNSITLK